MFYNSNILNSANIMFIVGSLTTGIGFEYESVITLQVLLGLFS